MVRYRLIKRVVAENFRRSERVLTAYAIDDRYLYIFTFSYPMIVDWRNGGEGYAGTYYFSAEEYIKNWYLVSGSKLINIFEATSDPFKDKIKIIK